MPALQRGFRDFVILMLCIAVIRYRRGNRTIIVPYDKAMQQNVAYCS